MNCSTPGFPVLHHLPELAQIHVHWIGDDIQPSHPLSTPFSSCLNLSPKPQLKRINSSVLSLLYGTTLTSIHDYWKKQSFGRQTFVDKVMPLLFNMLSRLVIAFLPRRKHLLISWLQLPSSDFGAQEDKVCHCFHFFHNYLPWSDGTRCHDLSCLNIEF